MLGSVLREGGVMREIILGFALDKESDTRYQVVGNRISGEDSRIRYSLNMVVFRKLINWEEKNDVTLEVIQVHV